MVPRCPVDGPWAVRRSFVAKWLAVVIAAVSVGIGLAVTSLLRSEEYQGSDWRATLVPWFFLAIALLASTMWWYFAIRVKYRWPWAFVVSSSTFAQLDRMGTQSAVRWQAIGDQSDVQAHLFTVEQSLNSLHALHWQGERARIDVAQQRAVAGPGWEPPASEHLVGIERLMRAHVMRLAELEQAANRYDKSRRDMADHEQAALAAERADSVLRRGRATCAAMRQFYADCYGEAEGLGAVGGLPDPKVPVSSWAEPARNHPTPESVPEDTWQALQSVVTSDSGPFRDAAQTTINELWSLDQAMVTVLSRLQLERQYPREAHESFSDEQRLQQAIQDAVVRAQVWEQASRDQQTRKL